MAPKDFEISNVTGTLAWARVPARKSGSPLTSPQSCDRHGKMDQIDTAGFTVEKNGVLWEVDPNARFADGDGAEIHYCEACIDESLRTYERSDAPDMALLKEAVADEWTHKFRRGQMNTSLFSVAEVTDDATPEFCPLCSGDLEVIDETTVECDIHGPMDLSVDPIQEVEPK